MSLQQSFDRRPAATGTPGRVFPAVARTPRLLEPKECNHPLGVLLVTAAVSFDLALLPSLPAATGLMALAIGLALTAGSTLSYLSWPRSQEKAVAEATWVAHQSGYRISVHGEELRWIDRDGMVKRAAVVHGAEGWDLVLTDQDAAGSFAF